MINYTQHIERFCIDICKKVPQLQHIDPTRIAYSVAYSKKNARNGRVAAMIGCTPKPGSLAERLGIKSQRLKTPSNKIAVYMMRIYFPCFFKESIDEKLDTLIHELWHIGEKFDGRLRANGSHYAGFQDDVNTLIEEYIDNRPNMRVIDWFRTKINLNDVWGWKYPIPKGANLDKILGDDYLPRKKYVESSLVKINL